MNSILELFNAVFGNIIANLSLFALVIYLFLRLYVIDRTLLRAHNIAIIGFPKAGKTTLITALFGELFALKIFGIDAIPRGTNTIERVNSDLEKLNRGDSLGPTTDQDLFAYRTNISIGRFPKRKVYKVEIGDFPGSASEQLAAGKWLHGTEYFKWVIEADAFIFVVDLAMYLEGEIESVEYVAKMSSAIRAAWQNLQNHYEENYRNFKQKPVLLAFTKADLFGVSKTPAINTDIQEKLLELGFGNKLPLLHEVNKDNLNMGMQRVGEDFRELISYIESGSNNFETIFVSSVGLDGGKRLNFDTLFRFVLPSERGTLTIIKLLKSIVPNLFRSSVKVPAEADKGEEVES